MNIQEYGNYFFGLIQRAPGQPADDYEAVLGASGIPAGLPPYTVPDPSMPHHALTQQIGSDGRIAGRAFLPTASPDGNGYYSHPISPLKDGPTPGSLLWEWRDLGGPPVVTPGETDSGTDGGTPSTPGMTEAQVQAMIDAAIEPLAASILSLQEIVAQPLHAHGPVDLPIVLKSLTSLRAKGDINVEVKPGEATPPAKSAEGDTGKVISGIALLNFLRRDKDKGAPDGDTGE